MSDKWQHGRKQGRAVCTRCGHTVLAGEWVKRAPGMRGAVRHAFRCTKAGG